MRQGPPNPGAPNMANNPQGDLEPFLWAVGSSFARADQLVDQAQLVSCQNFAQQRAAQGVSGPLSVAECAALMSQLGLQQAPQSIISPAEFVERLDPNRADLTKPNNLASGLLAWPGAFSAVLYTHQSIQRLEFAAPELWAKLMQERAYYEAMGQTSQEWLGVAYEVYTTASNLISPTDPDYPHPDAEHLLT